MKKLLCFIFTFIFVNLFNFVPALAADRSYEINKVDINAVIMDNGDINVTEYLTYDFLGDFNGFIRDLNSNGSDGCIVNSVAIINESGVEIISTNEDVGSENTYELSDSGDKTSIKVYSKSSNEEKTLKVNYTAVNVAKKYESNGELYWNFYSVENVDTIDEANLNISVNNQILTDENSTYQIFGEGELSTTYINDGININYKNLSSLIGIDLVIPSEFLLNGIVIENNQDNSVNDSNEYIYQENNYSNNYGSENSMAIALMIVTIGIGTLIGVLVLKNNKYNEAVDKYRSGYSFNFNMKYTEPPSEISPTLVNLLMGNKHVSTEILSSTLFYLCNLGYYNIEKYEYVEKGFFGDKTTSDLVFKRNVNKELPKEQHLEFIITWFSIYEEDNKFSLLEIERVLKRSSEGNKFLSKLNEWKDIVESDWKSLDYFTIIENKNTLTNEAYNEKLKWISYKEFIENTINLKERLNEINTADTMIIYSSALGINKNLIEPYINNLISSLERDEIYDINSLNNINRTYYFNYYLMHMNTMNSIYNVVMPNNTAGIDTGGGFTGGSSGGDFGGGGGGGSDAF